MRFQSDLKRPFFLALGVVPTPAAALSLRLLLSLRFAEPAKREIIDYIPCKSVNCALTGFKFIGMLAIAVIHRLIAVGLVLALLAVLCKRKKKWRLYKIRS